MDEPQDPRRTILSLARPLLGEPSSVELLGGWSGATTFRVRSASGSAVAKSVREAEAAFYTRVAPLLRGRGVPIPHLLGAAEAGGEHWLLLEDVPLPASREDLEGRALEVIARLHRATRGLALEFPAAPMRWDDAATEAALGYFGDVAATLRPVLRRLAAASSRLHEPWCWVSGDTSLPNWGKRGDGELVLFDWELFRPGIPACDLAPTIMGLGDGPAFRSRAEAYCEVVSPDLELPWTVAELARDIALAKAANVVLMLSAAAGGRARVPAETIAWLKADLPGWLEENFGDGAVDQR